MSGIGWTNGAKHPTRINFNKTNQMKDLLWNIAIEQAQMQRLYCGIDTQHNTPKRARKIRAGLFGIIKGDTVTYQDESGTVTTKKLSEV